MVGHDSRWGRLREAHRLEPATDARPADEARVADARADPDGQRRIGLRRAALLASMVTFFLAGTLVAFLGRGGAVDLHRKRDEARRLRAEVAALELDVGVLGHVVHRLKTEPEWRERVAREQLGMLLPEEIDYLLPPEPVQPTPADRGRTGTEASGERPAD
jgi:cell division protein FtsB